MDAPPADRPWVRVLYGRHPPPAAATAAAWADDAAYGAAWAATLPDLTDAEHAAAHGDEPALADLVVSADAYEAVRHVWARGGGPVREAPPGPPCPAARVRAPAALRALRALLDLGAPVAVATVLRALHPDREPRPPLAQLVGMALRQPALRPPSDGDRFDGRRWHYLPAEGVPNVRCVCAALEHAAGPDWWMVTYEHPSESADGGRWVAEGGR